MDQLTFAAQKLWDAMRWRRLGIVLFNIWFLAAVILDKTVGISDWTFWLMCGWGWFNYFWCWWYGNRKSEVSSD